jgi:MYXO-CTERM domain-containing protein
MTLRTVVCLVAIGGGASWADTTEGTERRVVMTPPAVAANVSHVLFLNRCIGGCVINQGGSNAATHTSSIPTGAGPFTVTAYAWGDAEWAQVLQCMQEVYSPYDVMVTDQKPTSGTYDEELIAGNPTDIGLTNDILGIAPLTTDCSPLDNVLSFTFANHHAMVDRALNVCWTAAQEAAHMYGLDHEYQFVDKTSACDDPMTYRNDCGGEKFFRNKTAQCGETAVRPCHCTATQNSHKKLLDVFGPGTPITGLPTSVITFPMANATLMPGQAVTADAGSKRGVETVALNLNGYSWVVHPGAPFGLEGQPDPSHYAMAVPTDVPEGIIDIIVKAYDDLGAEADSTTITVTKGTPCVTADTCAYAQHCDSGRCLWDPPSGEIGDSCTYKQFCKSDLCQGPANQQICTTTCSPDGSDPDAPTCPENLPCTATSDGGGICFFPQNGGCCSTGGDPWGAGAIAVVILGVMQRRRRDQRVLM